MKLVKITDKNGNSLEYKVNDVSELNPTQLGFGLPERSEFDLDGNETILPAEYTIEVSDIPVNNIDSVKLIVSKAIQFGQALMVDFASENVIMGITQDGKTKAVRTAFADTLNALQTGSLYDAISEAQAITYRDEKYVTDARIVSFVAKIQAYLAG